ncbi:adaptive-response sensory-kinase SasA [Comamonadaceae bacterium OS-1]|nr:adaptive-response sensory-kinase SasA [Comamonadaceae bacterium OS-1]
MMRFIQPRKDAAYRQELHGYLIFNSRAACLMTIVLVLAGLALDHIFYPQFAPEFLRLRVAACVVIGLVLLSYQCAWGRDHIKMLTYFWLCVPQAMVSWMIYKTNGEQSIYFVGLTFVLSGMAFFLPISFMEAVFFGTLTLAAYCVACVWRQGGIRDFHAFGGNALFMLFYAIIGIALAVYNERWRWLSFRLKKEIQLKNAALQHTNQALADIKGHMMQQEKMAALGTLAAGLLHEVNNPVNYSLMALNMSLMDPAVLKNADLQESLGDAKEGMQRVQSIVSDLKTFAYQQPGDASSSRIFLFEKALQSALRLTGFELKGIAVPVELPMDTHVRGDEPALIGVLINLLGNAALALHKAARANPRIEVRAVRQGDRLEVTVRDNGTGIQPEHLARVFEPFFTTRDVGKGLGLGLSVSYAIVQRHGGSLRVSSEPGAWTEFAFDLGLAHQNV